VGVTSTKEAHYDDNEPQDPRDMGHQSAPYTSQDGHEYPLSRFMARRRSATRMKIARPANRKPMPFLIAAVPYLYDALLEFFNIMHDYESSLQRLRSVRDGNGMQRSRKREGK
jgi:hypothetical protein